MGRVQRVCFKITISLYIDLGIDFLLRRQGVQHKSNVNYYKCPAFAILHYLYV